jgi:poly(3-hydroxybutyrate) depolymerase
MKANRSTLKAPLLCMVVAVGVGTSLYAQSSKPEEPNQPTHGPGSSEVISQEVTHIKIADGGQGGWLFLPTEPRPSKAPLVIFCHGWAATLPRGYQAWIDHIVKRGNIVLWPNYQDKVFSPTGTVLPNAIVAIKAGFKMLESNQYGIQPDLTRVAVVGHSAGGMIAAGIAARAKTEGLPDMKALMSVEPGDSQRGGKASVPLDDLSSLPADTLMIVMVGQDDTSVGTHDGERILHESISVPSSNKALFMLHSDDHGSPELIANHYAPSAVLNADGSYARKPTKPALSRNTTDIGVVNALDYMGMWRLLDQLLDAAFANPADTTLFQHSGILSMGTWSDGVPVTPLSRLK